MDMERYIGRLLDGRYEILEIIGTGGMAVVFKARCHRLNRLVAVKILKDELTKDAEFRRRFHAESQAVAALSHPNIVSVYDVSTTDEADYIVMELIDGISLKQYMEKKGVLNWKETLHFAIQIAKALDHAHSRGIVHRDIKPHNVMVLKNGSVKVADFGIAQVMSKSNTLTKEALGSVHYISPEQAKGGRVDSRSDLYSLGVVMYEMMTGRPPYDGDTPVSVAVQHINGNAAMPSTLNPNIPGGLEQIIMKAMEKDPERRFATATAMLHDMDEFRKEPTILFDYNNTAADLDDITLIHSAGAEAAPQTTAEKVAAKTEEPVNPYPPRRRDAQPPKPQKKSKRREEIIEDEDKGGRIATITVVLFSLIAIVAVGIVIYMLFQGGVGSNVNNNLIVVPNLQNKVLEEEQTSTDYIIIIDSYAYDEFYEKGHIISQKPDANTRMEKGDTIRVVVSAGPEPKVTTMDPRLIGMDASQAKQFLTGTQGIDPAQIKVVESYNNEVEAGKILRTEPAAGEEIKEGSIVTLYVSKGQEVKSVTMVDLTSAFYNEDSALKWLDVNGFTVTVVHEKNETVPAGRVFYQSEPPFTQVPVTTPILIKVSMGNETGPVVTPPAQMDPEDYVAKTVTIDLPAEVVQGYKLSIYREIDGALMDERTILPGTLSIQVNLSGKGLMYFLLQPDVGEAWVISVDFGTPQLPDEAGGQ